MVLFVKKGSSCVFYDIVVQALKDFRKYSIFLAAPSYLGGDETHGTHMGQAKCADDVDGF